jgi:hypothetical protein
MLPALTLALAGADGCIKNNRRKVSEKGILVRIAAFLVRTGGREKEFKELQEFRSPLWLPLANPVFRPPGACF